MQLRRLVLIGFFLSAAFAGLCYRLIDLQVLRHEYLAAKSQENTHEEFLLQPQRGDILNIKGNLLATSMRAWTVCADPTLIGNRQSEVARAIAPLLKMTEVEIVQKLTPRPLKDTNGELTTNISHYALLKRKVPHETWQKIKEAMNNLSFGLDEKKLSSAEKIFYRNLRQKAIHTEGPPGQLRVYPHQTLAAHVIGFVGTEPLKINGVEIDETKGREGIEATFDSKRTGVRGWRITERDSRAREVVRMREQEVEPCDGFNVVLTIDSAIQQIVEATLAEGMEKNAPVSISAIVARPRTGEILAMASLPTFDPNRLDSSSVEQRRNRIITDAPEPGST